MTRRANTAASEFANTVEPGVVPEDEGTNEAPTIQQLSVLGGPLHRLGCRLGLVRGEANTVRVGVALGLLAWGVLLLLGLLAGLGPKMLSLAVIGVHVRFLVAVPLFFLCEWWVVPQMAEFSRYIARSGLVPHASVPALASIIRRIGRMKESWLPEALFLLTAFALPIIGANAFLPGRTSHLDLILHSSGGGLNLVAAWYQGFCLPLFRFLILRWFWRLGLWCYFLWSIEKLTLRLIATNSDGCAGLGYLETVHENFAPLIVALSAVCSAAFAEDLSSRRMPFESLYSSIPLVVLLAAGLFIGPLFIFSSKLYSCRWTGISEYMGMASHYVMAFDRKWIRNEKSGASQLGTSDLQSLADLTNSLNVVRGMRPIPASKRLIAELALSAILPLLPLLFFKYPVDQLAARLFQALTGL